MQNGRSHINVSGIFMNFLALHAGSVDKERHPLKLGVVVISDFILAPVLIFYRKNTVK